MIHRLGTDLPPGKAVVLASASWCGSCKAFRPIVEYAAALRKDLAFHEVDIETRSDLIAAWGLDAVPTVVLLRGGKPVARQVGYASEKKLIKFLDDNFPR